MNDADNQDDDSSEGDFGAQVASATAMGAPTAQNFPPQSDINAILAGNGDEEEKEEDDQAQDIK